MKNILKISFLAASLFSLATTMTGCIVSNCGDDDPNTTCTDLATTKWLGSETKRLLAYEPAMDIVLKNDHGDVIVKRGSDSDTLSVVFKPYSWRTSSDEERAAKEMNEDLEFTARAENGRLLIEAKRDNDAHGFLGVDMVVNMPKGFDGGIEIEHDGGEITADLTGGFPAYTTVHSDGGKVTIEGAAGRLDLHTDGDTAVSVQAWSDQDGAIIVDYGNIDMILPLGSDGSVTALAGEKGEVRAPHPMPDDWAEAVDADNAKSYTFGDGSGATVQLVADSWNGSISLEQS